jgi:hypothetical protein
MMPASDPPPGGFIPLWVPSNWTGRIPCAKCARGIKRGVVHWRQRKANPPPAALCRGCYSELLELGAMMTAQAEARGQALN